MPGCAWRRRAIRSLTLYPGSWPPSPGSCHQGAEAHLEKRGSSPKGSSSRQGLIFRQTISKRGHPASLFLFCQIGRRMLLDDPLHGSGLAVNLGTSVIVIQFGLGHAWVSGLKILG